MRRISLQGLYGEASQREDNCKHNRYVCIDNIYIVRDREPFVHTDAAYPSKHLNQPFPRRSNTENLARHVESTSTLINDKVTILADPPFYTHQLLQVCRHELVRLLLLDLTAGLEDSLTSNVSMQEPQYKSAEGRLTQPRSNRTPWV